MKKIGLFLIVCICACTVNAQVYLDGTFGLAMQTIDGKSTTSAALTPGFGYTINDALSIGLNIDYTYNKEQGNGAVTLLSACPYVRWTFGHIGNNIGIFLDGVFEYGVSNQNFSGLSGGLRPGVSVALNNNWRMLCTMYLLSFTQLNYNYGYSNIKVNVSTFQFNPTSVCMGIQYSF